MISKIKNHFILVDKCADETRIVEIKSNKIVKITCWQDEKPPLIGNILDATVLKTLNSGIVRASLNAKKMITVRVGTKFLKTNEKIKVIITSEEYEDKPIQAKLWSGNCDLQKINIVKRIIGLFFNKNIPVIEDNHAIYWNDMDLDSCFFNALDPMIKIKDGGVLWIEKTKAATLIDIDTKNILINNEDEMLKFCKDALMRYIMVMMSITGLILVIKI